MQHDSRLFSLCDRLSSWLYQQRNETTETYNWWNSTSPTHEYPDDIDDTACAWHALFLYSHIQKPSNLLARLLQLLFALEEKPGGPYKTWIVGNNNPVWNTVDFVVQCNVLYLLSYWNITLESCLEYVIQSITQKTHSEFYPPLSAYYFFARMYALLPNTVQKLPRVFQAVTTVIVEIEHSLRTPGDKHRLALSLTILMRLGKDYESLLPYVRILCTQAQRECRGIVCLNTKRSSQTTYAGSPLLTDLFCLEALSLYQSLFEKAQTQHTIIISTIKLRIHSILKTVPKHLRIRLENDISMMWKRIPIQEICMLPTTLYVSTVQTDIDSHALTVLSAFGCAQLFGWIAYTLLDDLIDQENTRLDTFHDIIWFLRQSQSFYAQYFSSDPSFLRMMEDMIQHCENAHIIAQNARTIDIQTSVQRSFSASLGCFAVLRYFNVAQTEKEQRHVRSFFWHYLKARQLQDDMHDWEEDLRAKKYTEVVRHILLHAHTQTQEVYTEIFWTTTFYVMHKRIMRALDTAEEHMHQFSCIHPEHFFMMIENMKHTVQVHGEYAQSIQALMDQV